MAIESMLVRLSAETIRNSRLRLGTFAKKPGLSLLPATLSHGRPINEY